MEAPEITASAGHHSGQDQAHDGWGTRRAGQQQRQRRQGGSPVRRSVRLHSTAHAVGARSSAKHSGGQRVCSRGRKAHLSPGVGEGGLLRDTPALRRHRPRWCLWLEPGCRAQRLGAPQAAVGHMDDDARPPAAESGAGALRQGALAAVEAPGPRLVGARWYTRRQGGHDAVLVLGFASLAESR